MAYYRMFFVEQVEEEKAEIVFDDVIDKPTDELAIEFCRGEMVRSDDFILLSRKGEDVPFIIVTPTTTITDEVDVGMMVDELGRIYFSSKKI